MLNLEVDGFVMVLKQGRAFFNTDVILREKSVSMLRGDPYA